MSIKGILFYLCIVGVLWGQKVEVKGRIRSCHNGIIGSNYNISLTLRDIGRYTFVLDTTNNYARYKKMVDSLDEAMGREALVSVFHDSLNMFDSIVVHYQDVTIRTIEDVSLRNWKRPSRAGNGYNVGDSVIHGGDYTSLINNNMWSPREAPNYWKRKTTDFHYINFKKPTGAHNCYNTGFKVLYNGDVYESLIDGNIWSPDEYRRGWKYIHRGPASMIDSAKLADHSYAESTTRSSAPTYTQPTGAHDAYKRGDLVSLDGITYRSIIDANVWSPIVARAYWEVVSGTRSTAEWKKPSGIHDCYHKGYKILFNGKTYQSLMNSNVWSPVELPSSWKELD